MFGYLKNGKMKWTWRAFVFAIIMFIVGITTYTITYNNASAEAKPITEELDLKNITYEEFVIKSNEIREKFGLGLHVGIGLMAASVLILMACLVVSVFY